MCRQVEHEIMKVCSLLMALMLMVMLKFFFTMIRNITVAARYTIAVFPVAAAVVIMMFIRMAISSLRRTFRIFVC